eukprot:SAG22_NODE_136_length_18095_cov_19.897255_1_plen_167_part_10
MGRDGKGGATRRVKTNQAPSTARRRSLSKTTEAVLACPAQNAEACIPKVTARTHAPSAATTGSVISWCEIGQRKASGGGGGGSEPAAVPPDAPPALPPPPPPPASAARSVAGAPPAGSAAFGAVAVDEAGDGGGGGGGGGGGKKSELKAAESALRRCKFRIESGEVF